MYTREKFEEMRIEAAKEMRGSLSLSRDAIELIEEASKYKWIHQTNWMGEPALQLSQDLFMLQEIIYKTRPTLIVEVGVCWGGTALFCASAMKTFDIDGEIVGIDIYTPRDLKQRIGDKRVLYKLPPIELWTGNSIGEDIGGSIWRRARNHDNVLVILDSYHTHGHVLEELKIYSQILRKGNYIVVCDTIVEDLQQQDERPWGKGNNPRTALNQFLTENPNFERDEAIHDKMLVSCHPDGYIRKLS